MQTRFDETLVFRASGCAAMSFWIVTLSPPLTTAYGGDDYLRTKITAVNWVYVVGFRTISVARVTVAAGATIPEPASVEAIALGLPKNA